MTGNVLFPNLMRMCHIPFTLFCLLVILLVFVSFSSYLALCIRLFACSHDLFWTIIETFMLLMLEVSLDSSMDPFSDYEVFFHVRLLRSVSVL